MSVAKAVRDATQDAVSGLRVLVLTGSLKSAAELHEAFEMVEIGDIPRKVSRVNGRWGAEFPKGGAIRFYSVNASSRGWSADRVYMPANLSDKIKADIIPIVAASRSGDIIEYTVE